MSLEKQFWSFFFSFHCTLEHWTAGKGNLVQEFTSVVSRYLGAGVPLAYGMDFFGKLCTPCCTAPGGHLPSQGVCSAMPSFGCCVSVARSWFDFRIFPCDHASTIISSSVFSSSFFATYSVSLFESSSSHLLVSCSCSCRTLNKLMSH